MYLNVWGTDSAGITGKVKALRHTLQKKGLKLVILVSISRCYEKRKLNQNRIE